VNCKTGILDGPIKWWHDDGSKYIEGNFKNGKRHGSRTIWNKEGNVTFSATYDNGESNDQNGLESQYDDQGALTHYIEYKYGVIVNDNKPVLKE
jgi:antitoxin component YwqK of YwqJK toxin-antitoxin module